MRAVNRSARPPALDKLANGMTELARARVHFVNEGKKDGFAFRVYSDPEVKTALSELFGGFCAYCESYYDATQPQDVEHFRPKGRIDTAAGKIKPGYWWLGSEWNNLVPSCINCNRESNQVLFDGTILKTGKGDRFPIDDEGKRAKAEGEHAREEPLLIDPCSDDPGTYLTFSVHGDHCIVAPIFQDPTDIRYRRARASIDIYGLNRANLVKDRSRYLMRIRFSLRQLERLVRWLDDALPEEILEIEAAITDEISLLRSFYGGLDRFSAMARIFIDPVVGRLGLAI